MEPTAVIFSGSKGDTATPVRDLEVGGLGITRRIMHALRSAGCARAFVAADTLQQMTPASLSRDAKGLEVTIVPTGSDFDIPDQDACFIVSADMVVDARILTAMKNEDAPCVMVASAKDPGVVIAKVPAAWLRAHAPLQLDHKTFERLVAAAWAEAKTIDLQTIDTYLASHRRRVPLLWQRVTTRAEARAAFSAILDAAQKGVQDWPAWYIHRPIERWITARLSSTPVTPNQITAIGAVLGLASAWLFAKGLFVPALVLALGVGVLDGVDGKLARVKLMKSTLGELEHVADKIVEYLIYLGMAYHFSETGYGAAPYVMAGALILFHFADEVQLEFFRRMSGKFMCDFLPFDRMFRMVDGRRNTQMWTFIPFVLYGAWFAGFCMICAYGIVTFFVHQWRFVVNSRRVLEDTSPVFTETFNRTSVIKGLTEKASRPAPAPDPKWDAAAQQHSRPAE